MATFNKNSNRLKYHHQLNIVLVKKLKKDINILVGKSYV